jgi:uncharacterized membrane protein (UPF0127 family)
VSAPSRIAAAALAALLALPSACSAGPGAPPGRPEAARGPRVILQNAGGGEHAVAVELARTPAEQQRGLMFRERLDQDAGMLFVFPAAGPHAFWMKNTLIPLDMIFIGDDGTVVGVVERAEPHSLQPRSGGVSRYVLEVNGGWAAAHGIRKGDRVRFEGIDPK